MIQDGDRVHSSIVLISNEQNINQPIISREENSK